MMFPARWETSSESSVKPKPIQKPLRLLVGYPECEKTRLAKVDRCFLKSDRISSLPGPT
jgi:hypothetical protein